MRYIAKVIFDKAKLSVLKFYYDFLKAILVPEFYELMETDTDSIYIALTHEKFEDNIDPEKMHIYEERKADYLLVDGLKYGKRHPNRYRIECEGTRMISLCSKSYCVYNDNTKQVKFSSKGVQKRTLYDKGQEIVESNIGTTIAENIHSLYEQGTNWRRRKQQD